MTLDLNDLLCDWPAASEEIAARLVEGRDGQSLIQLRIELGLLQMFPDGRPDGTRYQGAETVSEYAQRELHAGRELETHDWQELLRELHQVNYRRLALTTLAESAVNAGDGAAACGHLRRALRDVENCLTTLRLLESEEREPALRFSLTPTLIFNRARLRCRLHIVEQDFDDAIEEAKHGAEELEALLTRIVGDEEPHDRDAGVEYLHQLEQRLRAEKNIPRTLQEQLDDAIEREDFEEASRLRDNLRRRRTESA